MHAEQRDALKDFADRYVAQLGPGIRIADIGSFDVNGNCRELFQGRDYVGLDIEAGPNVDRVVTPEDFGAEQFDVVVSGSCLEHVFDLVQWVRQCCRIMKPGGILCVTVPHGMSQIPEHRYPVDCWRIWPDGARWLFRELEIIECRAESRDTVLIARKPME